MDQSGLRQNVAFLSGEERALVFVFCCRKISQKRMPHDNNNNDFQQVLV